MIILKGNKVSSEPSLFLRFISKIEGWKTRTKNLHWAAPRKNIHEYLDSFLDILSDYQDGLAEGYMGILGHMSPLDINGIQCNAENAQDLITEVFNDTCDFYESIPDSPAFSGIKSECETFIQNLSKYSYLFDLCNAD